MNKLMIIGNLTRDPELRDTDTGPVCSFTVAVNRRGRKDAPREADFIRVSAWNKLGENCHYYLAKGRKVFCAGPVRARAYSSRSGEPRAELEMTADEVEFLSPRGQEEAASPAAAAAEALTEPEGFTEVDDDELPF